jgi:hypothetical protein
MPERIIALDPLTVTVLTVHRRRQCKQRLAQGARWVETGLVFTSGDGTPLHPGWVSGQFKQLVREASRRLTARRIPGSQMLKLF